jgi:hypothetical protein
MIEVNGVFLNENHVIRIKKIENTLRIYMTGTAKDEIRYRDEILKTNEAVRIFKHFFQRPDFIEIIKDEIINRNHIIEVEPKINENLGIFQLKISTTENIEKKKQRYDVYVFYSHYAIRGIITDLCKNYVR